MSAANSHDLTQEQHDLAVAIRTQIKIWRDDGMAWNDVIGVLRQATSLALLNQAIDEQEPA